MKKLLAVILAVFAARGALAGPVEEVRAGSGVRFLSARALFEGTTFSTGSWVLPKLPGTLDLWVPLATVGLAHPQVVHLVGHQSGTTLTWTFDETLAPDLVSGSTHIQRVWGQIVAQAQLIPGATPCAGASCAADVQLTPGPGSSIQVSGCADTFVGCWGFSKSISVAGFLALAGLPRPQLTSLVVDLPASGCSSAGEVHAPGTVQIAAPAPASGAVVTVWSTDPVGVQVASVTIAAGHQTGSFTARVAPNYVGSARVTAAAGGFSQSVLINRHGCALLAFPFQIVEVPTSVLRPSRLLGDGVMLGTSAEGAMLFNARTGEKQSLSSLLGLPDAQVVDSSPWGALLGTAKGGTLTWTAHLRDPVPRLTEGVVPLTINPSGLSVVTNTKTGALAWLDDFGVVDAPEFEGLAVTRARGNSGGVYALTLGKGKETLPARLTPQGLTYLSDLPGEAVDVLDTGAVYGHGVSPEGKQQAFVADLEKTFTWLPLPSGCSSARVVDANEAGWVVGTAICEAGRSTPWLADPLGKVQRLDQLVKAPQAVLREALALGEDNTVLVRADGAKGESLYFFLQAQ
jgi:hypothetical protein